MTLFCQPKIERFIPMRVLISAIFLIVFAACAHAQVDEGLIEKEILDSLFIEEVENRAGPDKVLHAEPLFIDLIRDLGARKGEREWNVGLGLTDFVKYDQYTALVEYEWAPIDRLGLEVELPFSFYYPGLNISRSDIPQSRLNSLKLAAQYSFYVSEKNKTSMAVGYIHEFEMTSFRRYGKENLFYGNIYNPFFVAAKRWGNNFHTLLYTGPVILSAHNKNYTLMQVNSNFHYMIPGTRNFIGMEVNKLFEPNDNEIILRPQMRVGITKNLLVGIVTSVPLNKDSERLGSFLRIIYEPPH